MDGITPPRSAYQLTVDVPNEVLPFDIRGRHFPAGPA